MLYLVTAAGYTEPAGTTVEFDSKAMRKLSDNSSIVVMVENASSADGMSFLLDFRMLIKLH